MGGGKVVGRALSRDEGVLTVLGGLSLLGGH